MRRARRTQADLARHLNLDPSSLTKTIRGDRRLKADELVAIEAFFDGAENEQGVREPPRAFRRSTKIPVYGPRRRRRAATG